MATSVVAQAQVVALVLALAQAQALALVALAVAQAPEAEVQFPQGLRKVRRPCFWSAACVDAKLRLQHLRQVLEKRQRL